MTHCLQLSPSTGFTTSRSCRGSWLRSQTLSFELSPQTPSTGGRRASRVVMATRHLSYWSLYPNVEVRIFFPFVSSKLCLNWSFWTKGVVDVRFGFVLLSLSLNLRLVWCRLGLNVEDLTQRTLKFFGPGSEYDTPVNNPYRDKGGRNTWFFF